MKNGTYIGLDKRYLGRTAVLRRDLEAPDNWLAQFDELVPSPVGERNLKYCWTSFSKGDWMIGLWPVCYAIRTKTRHLYLPETKGRYSYNEPVANCIPRLHATLGGARITLTVWLKGHARVNWQRELSSFGEPYNSPDGVDYVPSDRPRNRDDMEIVAIRLYAEG